MLLLGLLSGIAQAVHVLPTPGDAEVYWLSATSSQLYPTHWGDFSGGQYLYYPPPVAQLSALLQPLGWPLFIVLWTTLIFACFWYCARWLSLPLVIAGLPAVLGYPIPFADTFLSYALLGNMQWILAALVLVAIRHPSAWSVVALTKTGPAIAGLWHVVRGEWRAARMAALTTVLIVGVSVALGPRLWVDWVGFVANNYTLANPPQPLFPVPFGVRLITAGALVAWGARTDRAWTIPVAAGWAVPALYGLGFLPFWTASLRLVELERRVLARRMAKRLLAGAKLAVTHKRPMPVPVRE
jgi:hypothetical protein